MQFVDNVLSNDTSDSVHMAELSLLAKLQQHFLLITIKLSTVNLVLMLSKAASIKFIHYHCILCANSAHQCTYLVYKHMNCVILFRISLVAISSF